MGPCPRMLRLPEIHASRRRLSSMVWLSTTACRPNLPLKRLRPPLLRNMRFSFWWLPSIAKHANLVRTRHWRAKKHMWSIHDWDHKIFLQLQMGFTHCNNILPQPI